MITVVIIRKWFSPSSSRQWFEFALRMFEMTPISSTSNPTLFLKVVGIPGRICSRKKTHWIQRLRQPLITLTEWQLMLISTLKSTTMLRFIETTETWVFEEPSKMHTRAQRQLVFVSTKKCEDQSHQKENKRCYNCVDYLLGVQGPCDCASLQRRQS